MNSRNDAKRKWEISLFFISFLFVFVWKINRIKCVSVWSKKSRSRSGKWRQFLNATLKSGEKQMYRMAWAFMRYFFFVLAVCLVGFCFCRNTVLPFGTLFATQKKTHFQRNSTKISLLFWRFSTHKNDIFALLRASKCTMNNVHETLRKCAGNWHFFALAGAIIVIAKV